MNEKPLVSVLLLSMNHEQFIRKCIYSLKEQTYQNIEIIYIDNASSDNTFETGKSLLEQSGITHKLFSNKESKGISKNLNFLYEKSYGDYIIPLSTDDWLTPDSIYEKINYLLQHPEFGMVYSSRYSFNYETKKIAVSVKKKKFKEGWILKDVLKDNCISTTACMIKRDTFETVGLYDENSPIEDWDMWIRIAEKFPIGCIKKELAYYGVKAGVNITGNIEFMNKGFNYILKKYSHYSEIQQSRKLITKINTYHFATKEPSLKTLKYILKNFQPDFFYLKQTAKTIIGMIRLNVFR